MQGRDFDWFLQHYDELYRQYGEAYLGNQKPKCHWIVQDLRRWCARRKSRWLRRDLLLSNVAMAHLTRIQIISPQRILLKSFRRNIERECCYIGCA